MSKWMRKMRGPVCGVAIGVAGLAAGPLHAAESTKASKQETIGVTTGLAVGAAAGGPFGAIIGAAAGAWLGDRYHRQDVAQQALAAELRTSEAERKRLASSLGMLNLSLARAIERGEQLDAILSGTQAVETAVGFRTGEATVRADAAEQLRRLGALIAEMRAVRVRVSGHADARGPLELNRELSEQRAAEVAALLAAGGIAADRLLVEAHGEAQASAAESDPDGLAFDRRVTIRLEHGEAGDTDVLASRE